MITRKAELSDLGRIMEIERSVFPDPWTESQIKFELINQPAGYNLVAVNDNVVSGYLMSHVIYDVVQLINIAVDLQVQHRGVGRLLMESFLKYLSPMSPLKIFLEVSDSNMTAINFYHKCGFNKIDRRKNYYHNGDDAFVMVKDLENNGLVQA